MSNNQLYNWIDPSVTFGKLLESVDNQMYVERVTIDAFRGRDGFEDRVYDSIERLKRLKQSREIMTTGETEQMRAWNAKLWHLYHQPNDPSPLIQEISQLVDTLGTMGELTPVKTGSAVGYTEAKTKNVFQAIWFAIKDLATEDHGSILSILKEARDLVVRPVKSIAEREGKMAGIQFLTQIYRILREIVTFGLRTGMETVGVASALGSDIYVAMHELADALTDTPRVKNISNGTDTDGDAGSIKTGDKFFDEIEKQKNRCQRLKKWTLSP